MDGVTVLEQSLFEKDLANRGFGKKEQQQQEEEEPVALVVVTQLVIVSRLGAGATSDLSGFAAAQAEAAKESAAGAPGEEATGVLLVFPKYAVHILELPSEACWAFLETLAAAERKGVLSTSKILISRPLSSRECGPHGTSVLALSGGKVVEYKTSDALETVVTDCIVNTRAIASALAVMTDGEERAAALSEVHLRFADNLVSQGMLEFLCSQEDLGTPNEYLRRYTDTEEPILDGEIVFPLEGQIFKYD